MFKKKKRKKKIIFLFIKTNLIFVRLSSNKTKRKQHNEFSKRY